MNLLSVKGLTQLFGIKVSGSQERTLDEMAAENIANMGIEDSSGTNQYNNCQVGADKPVNDLRNLGLI